MIKYTMQIEEPDAYDSDYPFAATITLAKDANAIAHARAFAALMSAVSFHQSTIAEGMLQWLEESGYNAES